MRRSSTSKFRLFPLVALTLASLVLTLPVLAKKKEAPAAAGTEADKKDDKKDEDSPFKDWDKTLKDVETTKGLFIIHRKYDNVWLEIAPEQLDKPFLMVSSLSSGLGKAFVLGGLPLDTDLWTFHRAGVKLQLLVKNTRFRAQSGTPMADAVNLSYRDSVLAAPKIISINKDTNHILIDFNDIFLADLPAIGLQLKEALGSPASFDRDRTALASLKNFPKNIEVEMAASYSAGDPKFLETVSDSRYLPIGLHYSLSELPDDGYQGRYADDRIGYFMTAIKDFSRDTNDSFFVRYVNRWNLEKQDPKAALSPPREPIVYYLDRTIPNEYREAVRSGILMWNKAFEAAGFKDAMVVRDPPPLDTPEGKDFDPEDVRYNTIRWITSTEPVFGAIGPSRVDPRNGHILDADILVEAAMVQNARRGYRNYIRTLGAKASTGAGAANMPWDSPAAFCNIAEGVELNTAVDAAAFMAMGETEPGGTVPEEYITEFFHWVVAHEVGHTLGLKHNFRASAAVPYERLNDKAFTSQHGLYDSVMEYPPANFSLDRAAQGHYYTPCVGDYDVWAIRYAYTPIDAKSSDEELPALQKIASESTMPGHEYGSDEDALAGSIPAGIDPTVNQFDLGSDPLAFARDRIALVRAVRSKLADKLIAPGESYVRLRDTMDALAASQSINLQIASKQIGGELTSRSHKGDPGERPAFVPVPAGRQRQAMALLNDAGFSDAAWEVPANVLDSLSPNRWTHWGNDVFSAPIDYQYTKKVLDIQSGLLGRLLHPLVLSRIAEVEARTKPADAYTLAVHMRTLTDSIFSEFASKSPGVFAISSMRRNLGRDFLDRMIEVLNDPREATPEDARSLARANLAGLDRRMGSVLAARGAGMDETTKAYLEESKMRVHQALEVQSVRISNVKKDH